MTVAAAYGARNIEIGHGGRQVVVNHRRKLNDLYQLLALFWGLRWECGPVDSRVSAKSSVCRRLQALRMNRGGTGHP